MLGAVAEGHLPALRRRCGCAGSARQRRQRRLLRRSRLARPEARDSAATADADGKATCWDDTWDERLAEHSARRVLRAAVANAQQSRQEAWSVGSARQADDGDGEAAACLRRLPPPPVPSPTAAAALRALRGGGRAAWCGALRSPLLPPPRYGAGGQCRPIGAPLAARGFGGALSPAGPYLASLFRHAERHAPDAGLQVELSRFCTFHAHAFSVQPQPQRDGGDRAAPSLFGLLFHAREYPRGFPWELGFCAEGSTVAYEPADMALRNILFLTGCGGDNDNDAGAGTATWLEKGAEPARPPAVRGVHGMWLLDMGAPSLLGAHCVPPDDSARAALTLREDWLGDGMLGDVFLLDRQEGDGAHAAMELWLT